MTHPNPGGSLGFVSAHTFVHMCTPRSEQIIFCTHCVGILGIFLCAFLDDFFITGLHTLSVAALFCGTCITAACNKGVGGQPQGLMTGPSHMSTWGGPPPFAEGGPHLAGHQSLPTPPHVQTIFCSLPSLGQGRRYQFTA